MRYAPRFACLATLLFLGSAPAWCEPITQTFTFSLSNFIDVIGNLAPPITSLSGSFTLNFDPTLTYTNTTTGLTINSLSGAVSDSTVVFSYSSGSLSLGGIFDGAGDIVSDTNDFVIQINTTNLADPSLYLCSDPGFSCDSAQGNQKFYASGYTTTTPGFQNGVFLATVGDGVPASITPEPSSFVLLASGLAGLGGMVRRRLRK